jgi:hypothetical protein
MFHPEHIELFAGNKNTGQKKCHLVGIFLKLNIQYVAAERETRWQVE